MYKIFSYFDKETDFLKSILWQSFDAILQDVSAAETIVSLGNLSVTKIMVVRHV